MQDKSLRLVVLEAERKTLDDLHRRTASDTAHTIARLQADLDRLKSELHALSLERDALRDENNANKERLTATETTVVQNENALKADRTKLRDELQKRTAKVRLLEAEKEQLLMEVGEANEQLAGAQRDAGTLRVDLGAFNDQLREQLHQNEILKFRNTELLEELKAVVRGEEEGKAGRAQSEERLAEENARLGSEVRETKSAAMHQIVELSNHVQAAQDENEVR
jgi:regulator of replication initiation timing